MFLNVLDTLLLLVIASSTAYIAYHYYRAEQSQADAARYENRLRLYRDIVQFLSVLSREGDISRQALQDFRARTQEGALLFRPDHSGLSGKAVQPGFAAARDQ